jgi:hypothetical protein
MVGDEVRRWLYLAVWNVEGSSNIFIISREFKSSNFILLNKGNLFRNCMLPFCNLDVFVHVIC